MTARQIVLLPFVVVTACLLSVTWCLTLLVGLILSIFQPPGEHRCPRRVTW